ncbi:seryl-tRNA synthetase [Teratosphaeria destructans]|uniref:Seryl-tRNA synthetase n=1 Tax=Teratosphaeria destructans TaxID=418781 RepID=A0A9W7SNK2_9PEZI|nr:seryl-tRNA synthetase [Teratosphaeria destructans]
MAQMAPRGFPQYGDGDVEIYLKADEKLVLHSTILSLHSEWFKSSFSDKWAKSGADASILGGGSASGQKRWVYELRFGKEDCDGILMRQGQANAEPSNPGETATPTEMISVEDAINWDDDMFDERLECAKAHKNLFCAIYHCIPSLDGKSFEEAKASIEVLMNVAEMYGCEDVVKKDIKLHIWHFRESVLDICVYNPVSMLEFSIRHESEWIYKEAATNILGRSYRFWNASRPALEEMGIYEMLERKRAIFVKTLTEAEHAIHNLRPQPPQIPSRRTAYCFLHDELRNAFQISLGCRLGPGYANIYHSIADNTTAGIAARRQRAIAYRGTFFTGAADDTDVFLQHVEEAFLAARKSLQPLLKNATMLQPNVNDKHRALTFMKIEDADLPWA